MKKILHEKTISLRNPPRNLEKKEESLFEHEFKKEIKSSYIFLKKISIRSIQLFFQFVSLNTSKNIAFLVIRHYSKE